MMDLHTRFERLGGSAGSTSTDVIEADLGRGRRAVRRRRTVQTMAGSVFGAAAIVAAFSVAGVTVGNGSAPATGSAPIVAESSTGRLKLVRYGGAQAKHFTVDTVPEGFFIQNDDWTGLTIAPVSVQNPGPDIDPSKSPMYDPRDLSGKIAVFLERKDYRGAVDGDTVTVGDHEAVMHPTGPGTWQLLISVSPDVYATVQFDVELSREQIIEVGAGLHVDPAAVAGATGIPIDETTKGSGN